VSASVIASNHAVEHDLNSTDFYAISRQQGNNVRDRRETEAGLK
jgi:hypothetical protein